MTSQPNPEKYEPARTALLIDTVENESAVVERTTTELEFKRQESNKTVYEYNKIASGRGLQNLRSHGLYIPSEDSSDAIWFRTFWLAKWACLDGGLVLMWVLVMATLDLTQAQQIAVIGFSVLLTAAILPAFLRLRSQIKLGTANPIYELRWELLISAVLFIVGFLSWTLTRGSSGTGDIAAIVYVASGPLAEVGLCLGSACFWILSSHYRFRRDSAIKLQQCEKDIADLERLRQLSFGVAVVAYAELRQSNAELQVRISLEMRKLLMAGIEHLKANGGGDYATA